LLVVLPGLAELWIARRSLQKVFCACKRAGKWPNFIGGLLAVSARLGAIRVGADSALYAMRAKPHKHWRFSILLIWQVGT